MGNVLDASKQQQVVALGRLGWSLRRIEHATGVRRETIGDYLRAAGVPVRGRGRPRSGVMATVEAAAGAATSETTAKPAISSTGVSTDSPPARAPSASACVAYRDLITEALGRGRNARAIWQDLVDDHGFAAGYASVRRFVRQVRGASTPAARVVIVTAPGEEAQVDYGEGPMVRPPGGGKYRRTRLFVLTLGYSRKTVYLLTWQSNAQIWATLHEQAFRRLGGAPRVLVLDNLREGVLTPDVYDPTINPLYRDVLTHYGVTALPCRVRDPDRKGKVERSVGHAKQTPLKGQRFESLEAAQAYLDRWTAHWADTRIHGTTKRQVAVMFAEEQPVLQALPVTPFRYYRYGTRTVHLDGCVEVEAAYYSAPPGWIGQRVQVHWTDGIVRLLTLDGQLLREHVRGPRGHHRIAQADRPAKTPASTLALLARARRIGVALHTICMHIHTHEGAAGTRRILGALALAKRYGPVVLDDAAKAALELRVPTYRFLRRYLERHPPLTLRQVDPLIRQLTVYRDLIDRTTGDPT
ncbi:Transposase [Luteitalea pratensis]|uniref:Transposase n=1 Tax=Luteitalea pratensis TaxID=1855912 RepID=A0A143PN03_LUTPR|nr:IS21 family transposase [Luteitalea pratensis]AMY09540.1 Transposase [Luteitalea pratensis]